MTASGYELTRPSGICAATEATISTGEAFYTVLVESDDADSFRRFDFCERAWLDGARPPSPWRIVGAWRGEMPEPKAETGPVLDAEDIEELFEQLEGANEQGAMTLRYLLALALMRKRKLVLERSRPAGDEPAALIVAWRGKGVEREEIEVLDPELDEESLAKAAEQIGQLMGFDGDPS